MSCSRSKRYLLTLGLLIFFVPFLLITLKPEVALAKDLSPTEETTVMPEIKLNVKSKELVKGKSYRLKVYNTTDDQSISFRSSDSTIATVSKTGNVEGLEIGTATIYVTVKEGNKIVSTLQCEITVGVPAFSIRVTQTDILLVVGQKTTLKTLVMPYNTVEVPRFTCGNSEVVSISTGGRITAKSVGCTYVYALVESGYSKCKVTVIDEDTYNLLQETEIKDFTKIKNLDEVLSNIATGCSLKVTSDGSIEVVSGSAIEVDTGSAIINNTGNAK